VYSPFTIYLSTSTSLNL